MKAEKVTFNNEEKEISLLTEIRDEIKRSRRHDTINGVLIAIASFLAIAIFTYFLTPQPYFRIYGWVASNSSGNRTLNMWFVNSGRAELSYANVEFTLNNATISSYKNSSNLYVDNNTINESFGSSKRNFYIPNYFTVRMVNIEPQTVGHLAIALKKNATDVNITFVDTQAALGDVNFFQYNDIYDLLCISGTCYKI